MPKWILYPDGRCVRPGVDYGQADPRLLALDLQKEILVIHQKGTQYWAGIGPLFKKSYDEGSAACYNSDSEPIECPYCSSHRFEKKELDFIDATLVEFVVCCSVCAQRIGHWAYGNWDPEYNPNFKYPDEEG